MLPAFRQRLVILIGLTIAALCWAAIAGPVSPANGSTGITLSSASAGWAAAVGLVILAGLPVWAAGTATAAMGNPLAGLFIASAGITVLAGLGGSSQGFLWRAAGPGTYGLLIVDLLIWWAWYAALAWMIDRSRLALRRRMPGLTSPAYHEGSLRRGMISYSTLLGLMITAALGAFLIQVMVRTPATGQIVGSVIVAYLIASLLGQIIVPQAGIVGIAAAPLLTGLAAYVYLWGFAGYGSHDQMLAAWYGGRLSGLAWVLPIHYASAGVLGCCLGLGLAQALDVARVQLSEGE